ncbi:ImpA family type VI secretion system protein [Variovorax sp. OV329]|uniref:type VI secretion system protein TssA n=1 Tax=Variovorax sp. OV329 TaxID=1882825 RepID=UPI0008E79ACE|nr:type VI secretion system ImpA family N-terminal domain-containing protein [Variovorax sp. OV329]SFN36180.1 type VI secretion system protein ImpA [Variovorax sp. OV329]
MHQAQPIDKDAPCGPSLEYDAEYAMLQSRLMPRAEAQYGNFVSTPDPVNWAEVERDCRRLLLRTQDINVHVWLCRARTRLAQSRGLAESLAALAAALAAWPDAIHPQLVIDGHAEPSLRANALAALADPEGLAGDVREIAVATSTALRLTVGEVERALSVPRSMDALPADSVRRQLAALQGAAGDDSAVALLAQAGRSLREIQAWATTSLGEAAPSLQGTARLLEPFAGASHGRMEGGRALSGERDGTQPASASEAADVRTPAHCNDALETRGDVLQSIRAARTWFELHEPSSPVAVLLLQAERMVGKRFSQVADSIPLELLRKWEAEAQAEAEGLPA